MAADEGDVNRVRALLQKGANPSHPLYWRKEWWGKQHVKWTVRARPPPLHTASYNGYLEIVKLLVKAGADVDKGDGERNSTPLYFATGKGHEEVTVYLIREVGCKTGEFVL